MTGNTPNCYIAYLQPVKENCVTRSVARWCVEHKCNQQQDTRHWKYHRPALQNCLPNQFQYPQYLACFQSQNQMSMQREVTDVRELTCCPHLNQSPASAPRQKCNWSVDVWLWQTWTRSLKGHISRIKMYNSRNSLGYGFGIFNEPRSSSSFQNQTQKNSWP